MFKSISLYLGIFSVLISFFSFLNILYSYYFEFYLNLNAYIYTLVVSLFFGIFFLLIKKKNIDKISLYEKLIVVFFGFLFFPLLISIPYYFSIYNLTFINSYFESISGFTSTGFTIFNDIKILDESIILWRSTSQWLGGLHFLFSLILVIDVFDIKLKNIISSFISINIYEIKKQFLKIFILYSFLTLIIFILLNLFELRFFDSLNLSMSIISSGGFVPANNISDIIITKNQYFITSLAMLMSYFSIFLSYNLISLKKSVNLYQEDILLLFYLIFLICITYIFFTGQFNYHLIFFYLASSISGIGFAPTNSANDFAIFFLFITIIGGGFFSTSSGAKFIKIYILIRFSFSELISNVRPKLIFNTRLLFSNLKIPTTEINKYFLSFVFIIISIFALSCFLSFNDVSFNESLTLSILTISNTVNSSIYNLAFFNFFLLNDFSKIVLISFMILGRVELLTLMILFRKLFLKN